MISCEQCTWFFNKIWDLAYEKIGKGYQQLEKAEEEDQAEGTGGSRSKEVVTAMCHAEEVEEMPYGPDLCKFFSEDALDEVMCLYKNDHTPKSACMEMACNGRDPWFDSCSSVDGASCDDASGECAKR